MTSQPQRNPVLLIHGIWDTGAIFYRMSSYLKELGWSVYDLDLTPNNGDGRLEQLAQQVADFADRAIAPDVPFDLIGFSMGGIVSRYYVQRLGGLDRVQRLITLSSPHHGTATAYGSLRAGCVQMRPNSPFLQELNRDIALLDQINFTSIWTPLDLMILPATSSQVPVGQEVQVWVPLHAWMVSDPRSLQSVAKALAEPFKPTPQPTAIASPTSA